MCVRVCVRVCACVHVCGTYIHTCTCTVCMSVCMCVWHSENLAAGGRENILLLDDRERGRGREDVRSSERPHRLR